MEEDDKEDKEEEEIEIKKINLKVVINEPYLYNLKRREISDLNKKKIEMVRNYKEKNDKIKEKK